MSRTLDDTTRARLIGLLEAGATNRAAADALGIDKETPARYRAALGIAPAPRAVQSHRTTITVEQAWRRNVQPLDGGHMRWVGPLNSAGVPTFSYRTRATSARVVAFRIRTGRNPVGYVKAQCDTPGCVAPQCVDDRPGRAHAAELLAELHGYRR
jgi:hypothetical protein